MLTPEQLEDYKQFRGTPIETLLQHVEEQAQRIRELEADGERLDWVLDPEQKEFGIYQLRRSIDGDLFVHRCLVDRNEIDAARTEVPRG